MLPSHTYANALMVRVRISEGTLYNIPAYFWYSSDNGAILLSYIVGDGFLISSNILYLHSLTVGIEENNLLTNVKFNNPVKENFHLSFESTTSGGFMYFVFNSLGEAVLAGKFNVEAQTQQDVNLDFSSLIPGMYIFRMESDHSAESVRSIKLVKME
jgi:hypothetical protein